MRSPLAALALAAALLAGAPPAAAQSFTIIRDTEIEATIQRLAGPVFEAARMDPQSVNVYIVRDDRLNAFVAGGSNLFLNTGLLMKTDDASQVIGVVAHEIGHITGGHLTRMGTALRRATAEAILGTLLGAAAAAAGAPEVGAAVMMGGQHVAERGFLRFTRSQEQQADQAAISYLERAGISARGLASFLRTLENQTALVSSGVDPYLLSHPLTRERIGFIDGQIARSRHSDAPLPDDFVLWHARMTAKLEGFLRPPQQVLQRYAGDDGLPARYARAIALYRLPDLQGALAKVGALIAEHPEDPYFLELKGQMLFENGRIAEAVEPYRQAARLLPRSSLVRAALAHALIESGDAQALPEARALLQEAVRLEPDNAPAWRLLGIAHGRQGEEALASLALAEHALLVRRLDDARLHARRAEGRLDPGDPAWIRLEDIKRAIDEVAG